MANVPYTAALDLMMGAGIGWEINDFGLMVIGTTSGPPASGYTFNADHATRQAVIDASDLVIDTVVIEDPDQLAAGRISADDIVSVIPPLGQRITTLVCYLDNSDPDLDVPLFHWNENANGSAFSRAGDGTVAPIIWSPSTKMAKAGL